MVAHAYNLLIVAVVTGLAGGTFPGLSLLRRRFGFSLFRLGLLLCRRRCWRRCGVLLLGIA